MKRLNSINLSSHCFGKYLENRDVYKRGLPSGTHLTSSTSLYPVAQEHAAAWVSNVEQKCMQPPLLTSQCLAVTKQCKQSQWITMATLGKLLPMCCFQMSLSHFISFLLVNIFVSYLFHSSVQWILAGNGICRYSFGARMCPGFYMAMLYTGSHLKYESIC